MYVQQLLLFQSLSCLAGYETGLRFKKVLNMNIAKIMIPKICTVVLHERSTIRQGLEVLAHCHYTAIPVLDTEEHYIGSVTEGDFLRHILKTGTTDMKEQEKYSVRDILRRDFARRFLLRRSLMSWWMPRFDKILSRLLIAETHFVESSLAVD